MNTQPISTPRAAVRLVALLAMLPAGGLAQTNWNTTTGAWETPGNWTAGVPDSADAVTIAPSGSASTITISGSAFANSLSIGATTNHAVELTGGSLTLASGNLAKTSTGAAAAVTIGSNIVLGADGIWSNATNTDAGNLRIDGVISGNHGITWQGGGRLRLYGANTFSGGITHTAGSIYLFNNTALGTGALTVNSGTTSTSVNFYASSIANAINLASNATVNISTGSVAGFNRDITFSGQITANTGVAGGVGQFNFTSGNSATWRFQESIVLRGAADGALRLVSTTASVHNTFIFSKNVSLSSAITEVAAANRGIYLVGSSGGSVNLLIDQAITFDGLNRITESASSGSGVNVIGGIHTAGTATISPTSANGVILNKANDATVAINLVSLHAGAVTDFATGIADSGATVTQQVRINDSFQQVDASSTTGSTTVLDTHNPEGIVVFSNATGNTYKGGTAVHAGGLLVNNTSGSGSGTGGVVVHDGAFLGGTGIIAPTTAGVVVESGGRLAPGDQTAVGTLRFNGVGFAGTLLTLKTGATLDFRLGANGVSDQIALWNFASGDLSLSGNVINFTDAGGLSEGNTYTLFTFFSDAGTSVAASGIASGLVLGSGLEAFTGNQLVYNANSIQLIVGASVIPEPSAYAVLLSVSTLLLAAARRRRR